MRTASPLGFLAVPPSLPGWIAAACSGMNDAAVRRRTVRSAGFRMVRRVPSDGTSSVDGRVRVFSTFYSSAVRLPSGVHAVTQQFSLPRR